MVPKKSGIRIRLIVDLHFENERIAKWYVDGPAVEYLGLHLEAFLAWVLYSQIQTGQEQESA